MSYIDLQLVLFRLSTFLIKPQEVYKKSEYGSIGQ